MSRESCAWSCGPLRRLFRGAEKSVSSLSSSWKAELGCSRDAMVGLATPGPCSPRWFAARLRLPLGCLLNMQLYRCLLVAVECAEIGGGGCLDDLRETRLQDLLREMACVSDHTLDARFACDESSQVCKSSAVSHSLEPIHRCRPLFLQDFVAVNLQDVVDAADAQTFSKEGELCLRILAMLDAIVHCTDDFSLVQELVRDELPRSDSNSECDATVCNCRVLGQAPDVANFPLKRCCVQVVHVVDYFFSMSADGKCCLCSSLVNVRFRFKLVVRTCVRLGFLLIHGHVFNWRGFRPSQ